MAKTFYTAVSLLNDSDVEQSLAGAINEAVGRLLGFRLLWDSAEDARNDPTLDVNADNEQIRREAAPFQIVKVTIEEIVE